MNARDQRSRFRAASGVAGIVLALCMIGATPAEARRERVVLDPPNILEDGGGQPYVLITLPSSLEIGEGEAVEEALLVVEIPVGVGAACVSGVPFEVIPTAMPEGVWAVGGAQRSLTRTRCFADRESGGQRLALPIGDTIEARLGGTFQAAGIVLAAPSGDGRCTALPFLPGSGTASLDGWSAWVRLTLVAVESE